jgi:hypothetical protein
MVYRDSCSGAQYLIPIEPFALVLRHPYLCKACSLETGRLLPGWRKSASFNKYWVNKDYMLVDWRLPPVRHAWYFDLGASTVSLSAICAELHCNKKLLSYTLLEF